MAVGAERHPRRTGLLLCGLAALASGCATRPTSLRGWSVGPVDAGYRLAFGRNAGDRPDFAVICDRAAGVADLVFRPGPGEGAAPGARTELLIAVGEQVDALPARVEAGDDLGPTVVARTRLPPAPVAEWIGQRLTIAAIGSASTLQVPPTRRQITTFMKGCGAVTAASDDDAPARRNR
jgi:hypothetical protein